MASSPPPPPSSSSSLSWLASSLRNFHIRHERLKRAVHEGFRYPLPRWGQWAMGGVYFVLPIVGGMCVMQWAIARSHANIGVNGERLPLARQKLRDDDYVVNNNDPHPSEDGGSHATTHTPPVLGLRRADGTAIGAGGWGGGVHLAVSDEETQRRNRKKLDKFLRKQQKLLQQQQQRTNQPKPEEEDRPVEAAAG